MTKKKRTPGRKKTDTVQITVTVNQADMDKIEIAANALAITRTAMIRNIIASAVNPTIQRLLDVAIGTGAFHKSEEP